MNDLTKISDLRELNHLALADAGILPGAVCTELDDIEPITAMDTLLLYTDGVTRRPIRFIANEIIRRTVEKRGPFAESARVPDINSKMAGAARFALMHAMLRTPFTLKNPSQDFRYAVINGGKVALMHRNGLIFTVDSTDLPRFLFNMAKDPECFLHYNRKTFSSPIIDAELSGKIMSVLKDNLVGLNEYSSMSIEIMKDIQLKAFLRKKKVYRSKDPMSTLANDYISKIVHSDDSVKLLSSTFSVANVVVNTKITSGFGFSVAVAKMIDKRIYRLTVRSGGHRSTYAWLSCADIDAAESRIPIEVIAERRRQFAHAYPEVVKFVSTAKGLGKELGAMVDSAIPVAEFIRSLRGTPKWVEKALRGRISATRGRGLFMTHGLPDVHGEAKSLANVFHRALIGLDKSWTPRYNDSAYFAVIAILMNSMCIGPESLKSHELRKTSSRRSPWKSVHAAMPAKFQVGANSDNIYSVQSYVLDYLDRMTKDIIHSFLDYRTEMVDPGRRRHVLNRVGFINILKASTEWHRVVHDITDAKRANSSPMLFKWPPLFQPIHIGGRYRMSCLVEQSELDENGRTLNHCVSTYDWKCMFGHSHIVEIFDLHTNKPVATAEINHSDLSDIQLRGNHNSVPPDDVRAAFRELMAGIHELALSSGWTEIVWGNLDAINAPAHPRIAGLTLTDRSVIDDEASEKRTRHAQNQAGYDVTDPVLHDRVMQAWAPAMPRVMYEAWHRGATPEARIANLRTWVRSNFVVTRDVPLDNQDDIVDGDDLIGPLNPPLAL